MRLHKLFIPVAIMISYLGGWISQTASGQSTSFGPGKGPVGGTSKSRYTYPQPPKPTVYSPTSIRPAYQVPELPEKSIWKLTSKVDGRDPATPTSDVPIYTFDGGRRTQVGVAKSGEEIAMDEIRPVGKATYYRVAWSAAPAKGGPEKQYWVSGSNIEYAGKK